MGFHIQNVQSIDEAHSQYTGLVSKDYVSTQTYKIRRSLLALSTILLIDFIYPDILPSDISRSMLNMNIPGGAISMVLILVSGYMLAYFLWSVMTDVKLARDTVKFQSMFQLKTSLDQMNDHLQLLMEAIAKMPSDTDKCAGAVDRLTRLLQKASVAGAFPEDLDREVRPDLVDDIQSSNRDWRLAVATKKRLISKFATSMENVEETSKNFEMTFASLQNSIKPSLWGGAAKLWGFDVGFPLFLAAGSIALQILQFISTHQS